MHYLLSITYGHLRPFQITTLAAKLLKIKLSERMTIKTLVHQLQNWFTNWIITHSLEVTLFYINRNVLILFFPVNSIWNTIARIFLYIVIQILLKRNFYAKLNDIIICNNLIFTRFINFIIYLKLSKYNCSLLLNQKFHYLDSI